MLPYCGGHIVNEWADQLLYRIVEKVCDVHYTVCPHSYNFFLLLFVVPNGPEFSGFGDFRIE